MNNETDPLTVDVTQQGLLPVTPQPKHDSAVSTASDNVAILIESTLWPGYASDNPKMPIDHLQKST